MYNGTCGVGLFGSLLSEVGIVYSLILFLRLVMGPAFSFGIAGGVMVFS